MTKEILEEFCKILNAIDAIISADDRKNNQYMRLEYSVGENTIYHRFDFEKYHWTNDTSLHVVHGFSWNDLYGLHEHFSYLSGSGSFSIEHMRYWSNENTLSVDFEKYKNVEKYRFFEDTNLIDFPKFLNDLKIKIVRNL